jgi:hypothetical protein
VAGGHSLNIKQGPGPRTARHPTRIRAGQLFFRRTGAQRLRFMVKRPEGEWVRVVREDGAEGSIALDRLLACDDAGNGIHYRFHGWKRLPRGYRTELLVLEVSAEAGGCVLLLPEWDPATEIEAALSVLPNELQKADAKGSCGADLTAQSVAALGIHACSSSKIRGLSRTATGPHPELLAEGQEYRRRTDDKRFRLLNIETRSPTVSAWNGTRTVRLDVGKLLALLPNGEGSNYIYLGGGLAATRRRRAGRSRSTP